jgi:hypothetical protein
LATPTTSNDTEIQRLLAAARAESLPSGWFVWHLRRGRVMRSALVWLVIALFGFVLLVPVVLATIPSNFESGTPLAFLTIILLAVFVALAIGGSMLCIGDFTRYFRADEYLLVMTPEDFLKVTPFRTIHVPMTAVAYVTLKGVAPPPAPGPTGPPTTPFIWSALFGGANASRRAGGLRGAPSLAFMDQRTKRHVVVATDDAFDDLLALNEILTLYAKGTQLLTSAS